MTALSVPITAQAQGPTSEATTAQATAALENAEAALAAGPQALPDGGLDGGTPDATVALNQLSVSYTALEATDRRRARGLLARPTDQQADQYGDGYPSSAPVGSAESPHFCVYWVNDASREDAPNLSDANGVADADGIPDYVEAILEIAEYSYSIEVAPGALGWAPPKPDREGCGADPAAHADIYLKQLGLNGLFGYESPDPGQGNARSQYGYMVIDDDYSFEEYGYPDPLDPAKVTFAHEFNHLLQQNYDSLIDVWMFESTATWVENQVYPEIDDYLFYVKSFAANPGRPITDPVAGRRLKVYGTAVWNHWLDSGGGDLGVATIRSAWELGGKVMPRDNAIAAYDEAIFRAGGKSFPREFARFAAATAEWRTGFGGFADSDRYPDVKRKGKLLRGDSGSTRLDHTGYRLIDVRATSGGEVELKVLVDSGVRCAIALVGRSGGIDDGTVEATTKYLPKGGKARLALKSSGSYKRITAVLVNADGRVSGRDQRDEWIYSRDGAKFEFELSR